MNESRAFKTLKISVFLLGFNTIGFQIVFFREQMSLYQGNELTLSGILACWLLWGGIGSSVYKILSKKIKIPLFPLILFFLGLLTIPTLLACRYLIFLSHLSPGEIVSISFIYISSFFILAPFCFLSGSAFAAAADLSQLTILKNRGPAWIYTWEAIGGVTAAFLQRLLLNGKLPPIESSIYLTIAILTASFLLLQSKKRYFIFIFIVVLVVLFFSYIPKQLELYTESLRWPGAQIEKSEETPYGRAVIVNNEKERSLFINGALVAHSNDHQTAEETVHLPLAFQPNPSNILILNGGFSGIIAELLKHQVKNITVVYLDPIPLKLVSKFPDLAPSLFNKQVSIIISDIRTFVSSGYPEKFDVILDCSPEPTSIGSARFYTIEYFSSIKKMLKPTGIYAMRLRSSENYLNKDQLQLLKCGYCTLKDVFSDGCVKIFPGETADILASPAKNNISYDISYILNVLSKRKIQSYYMGPGILPFRLSPFKLETFSEDLQSVPCIVSKDLNPKIFTSSIRLWKSQFHDFNLLQYHFNSKELLEVAIFIGVFLLLMRALARNGEIIFLAISIGSIGFGELACEILLVFLLQLTSGAAYLKTGMLLGVFAAGLAVGGYSSYRFVVSLNIKSYHIGIISILFSILMIIIIIPFQKNIYMSELVIDVFAFLSGFLGGTHFSLASRKYPQYAGAFYGIDLLGSSLGAILVSLLFLPNISIDVIFYVLSIISLFPGLGLLFKLRRST